MRQKQHSDITKERRRKGEHREGERESIEKEKGRAQRRRKSIENEEGRASKATKASMYCFELFLSLPVHTSTLLIVCIHYVHISPQFPVLHSEASLFMF